MGAKGGKQYYATPYGAYGPKIPKAGPPPAAPDYYGQAPYYAPQAAPAYAAAPTYAYAQPAPVSYAAPAYAPTYSYGAAPVLRVL